MGLDLGPQAYLTETTDRSWPKCCRCTEKFRQMRPLDREALGIDLPYPVEAFQLLTRESPGELASKYRLVAEARCHGAVHRFVMDCPRRWGLTAEQQAFGTIWVFVPGAAGSYRVEVRRGALGNRLTRDLQTSFR
jgi:hypothetical protein